MKRSLSGFGANAVPSPSVRLCQIDPETRLCVGCFRTMAEIAGWSFVSDPERQRVLDEAKARRGQASNPIPSPSPRP